MELDDLVLNIDSMMAQIDAYPNLPRAYLWLYNFLEPYMLPKTERRFYSTFMRRTTVKQITNKYRIELRKGFFTIELFVDRTDEGKGVWISTPILPPDWSREYGTYIMENGQRKFLSKSKYNG